MTAKDAPTDHGGCRSQDQTSERTPKALKNKLIVLGARGGTGKSVVATCLAVCLAEMGHEVGLLDLDLCGPSSTRILGLKVRAPGSPESSKLPIPYSAKLKVASVEDFVVMRDSASIWDGALTTRSLPAILTRLDWGKLEYFLVNLPPGVREEASNVCQSVAGFRAIVVTTPQDRTLTEIRECVRLCHAAGVPVIGLIQAVSGFICRQCGTPYYIFDDDVGRGTAKTLDLAFLGRVPVDPVAIVDGPRSLSTVMQGMKGPISSVFQEVAAAVLTACEGDSQDDRR